MSMENVKKFMELVQTEEGLAKRMVALKDGLQEGEFSFKNDKEFVENEILPLAKEYGLEFAIEDFMDFTSSQLTSLSEEDLADVSGGFPGLGLLIGLSVFLGGAATPTIASKAVSYFTGGGTSTVQSVTEQDVDMSGTARAEDIGNKIEFDERFKEIKKDFIKRIKAEFDNVTSYISPQERSTWIESIARQQEQITQRENKHVNSRYNKANDRIEFTATWTDKLNDHMDRDQYSQATLNGKLGNLFKQQYQEAYGGTASQLADQWNELNRQLQQKQNEKSVYENQAQQLQQKNVSLQQKVDYCYTKLIQVCEALIQAKPHNSYQIKQWKQALQNRTFANWETLKKQAAGYTTTESDQTFYCSGYVDWLLQNSAEINNNTSQIGILNAQAQQAQNEISSITTQMNNISNQYQTYAGKQQAFSENMKTEFDYFYGELVKALKENDKELNKLAEEATIAEDKTKLANKIKEKADKLVKDTFSKQLLDGCSLVVGQQGDSIGLKIFYGGYVFNQGSFSVDDFIAESNHLAIIDSEASRKCDEVAKKLAEYMQKQYTKITEGIALKRTITSVLIKLQNGELNDLNLGIQIVNSDDKQVTFSLTSGGQQRDTILTIERIADEYNKMVNMQAVEATRQQNEGTIEYTPFGRKIWNSIGSQAQHVLNTIKKIEANTGNLSDVKDREAFENDLKHVANQIAEESRGNVKKMYLAGEHRNDYSFKMEDLQKIQEFASKIKK